MESHLGFLLLHNKLPPKLSDLKQQPFYHTLYELLLRIRMSCSLWGWQRLLGSIHLVDRLVWRVQGWFWSMPDVWWGKLDPADDGLLDASMCLLHLVSSAWWPQGSGTSYMVAGFLQSECSRNLWWELQIFLSPNLGSPRMSLPPHSLALTNHQGQPRFKERGFELYPLMGVVASNLWQSITSLQSIFKYWRKGT